MRTLWLAAATFLAVAIVGGVGYQVAVYRCESLLAEQRKQAKLELSLMLSLLSDIADHREKDEHEIARWKFDEAHGRLEEHIRGGGPLPSVFVPDIVEVIEVPAEDEEDGAGEQNDEEATHAE